MEKKYYLIGINKTWTNKSETKDFYLKNKGASIKESRNSHSDFTLFYNGSKIADLYESKDKQISRLKEMGLI